ncbi:hypothetical protein HanPSC8_Chr11g0489571 [Helianthus annuus]|nr:hypothetical protein HanPSC8_Chr11g0489571 [Helianthus annuus]
MKLEFLGGGIAVLSAPRPGTGSMEMELRLEKKCTEELDDALMRSINGHGRMVEHYADLQEEV